MPIYEYQAKNAKRSCPRCAKPFDVFQNLSEAPLSNCPDCGAPVNKLISSPVVGSSRSGLDDRAKNAGFHKLERRGKGEYEKTY